MKYEFSYEMPIDQPKHAPYKIQDTLEHFARRPEPYLILRWDKDCEYKSPDSMYTTWYSAVKKSGRPMKCVRKADIMVIHKIEATEQS